MKKIDHLYYILTFVVSSSIRIKCILGVEPEVTPMRGSGWGILHHWALGKLNSMGSWCTIHSNSMGGWCLRKLNSMGGWVKKTVFPPPPSPGPFSGIALK